MGRVVERYDVVVVGGGAAGVSAAVGAAATGARTVIVERYPFFGGAATISSVLTYCGFFTQEPRQVVRGVGEQLLRELHRQGVYDGPHATRSGNHIVLLDPEATKLALDRLTDVAALDRLLHARVIGAEVDGERVVGIECVDHGGRFELAGEAFVDASGDANLSHLAGARVAIGHDGALQVGSLVMRLGGVAADVDLGPDAVRDAIRRANAERSSPLPRERGSMARLPISGDVIAILVDEQVNGLSAPSLTHAELSAREQAWAYLEAFRRFLSGWEDAYLVATGPQIGVRETRHAVGRASVTRDDVLEARRHDHAIARGGWPIELHPSPGEVVYQSIAGQAFYDIPYGAICSADRENLWVAGRAIACDPDAFGSLRVMGTAFATGHAAGVAAAVWNNAGDHDAQAVRRELERQDACV